jgi:hypothetical protein
MKDSEAVAERRLLDRVGHAAETQRDPILGLVGTTYNLQPDFFDTDFLPALLGLGAWDDRGWTTRIAVEKQLQMMESAVILMEAKRYSGRPRSLRVEVVTTGGASRQKLHAKVMLVLRERTVSLFVGSANLTEPGYRSNREIVAALTASASAPQHSSLMHSAVLGMRGRLSDRLPEEATSILARAAAALTEWRVGQNASEDVFAWSGGRIPLWRTFLDQWPTAEKVQEIVIVSPFWSDEKQNGPLRRFTSEMASRDILNSGMTIRLLTEADRSSQGEYRPRLPASYAECDLSEYGVTLQASAVAPTVSPEEVGMLTDFVGTRSLHAKVVLLRGPETSLAYVGSANFTHSGWGFREQANIEAGIILRRSARRRAELQDFIPATIGQAVELGTGEAEKLGAPEPSPSEDPWPEFISEIVLSPLSNHEEELALAVSVKPEWVLGEWSIGLTEKGAQPARALLESASAPPVSLGRWCVPLDADTLNRLLTEQEVMVRWWGWRQGRAVPINVTPSARTSLPISPGSPDLAEEHLIAYYQGRIRWEDLFPDPEAGSGDSTAPDQQQPVGSNVDTSKIQSYQIREFVEALSGIRNDLREAGQSGPAMKLAILGPVSPVTLARTVMAAVKAGGRTPMAAGFQLVEILACVETARKYPIAERLASEWRDTLNKAAAEIGQFLGRLRDEHSSTLRVGGAFDRYERLVCGEKGEC